MPAQTAAKKILDRVLAGPDLLNELRPFNTPDSLSLGISPTYAATCFAEVDFFAENK